MHRKRWFDKSKTEFTSIKAAQALHECLNSSGLSDEKCGEIVQLVQAYGKERYEAGFLIGGRQYYA